MSFSCFRKNFDDYIGNALKWSNDQMALVIWDNSLLMQFKITMQLIYLFVLWFSIKFCWHIYSEEVSKGNEYDRWKINLIFFIFLPTMPRLNFSVFHAIFSTWKCSSYDQFYFYFFKEFEGRTLKVNYAKIKKKNPAPPVQPKPVPTFNLFIANLSFEARAKDLREFFVSEGWDIVSAEVIFHDNTRRSAGYGFVSFKSKKVAEAAISAFQGKVIMCLVIALSYLYL